MHVKLYLLHLEQRSFENQTTVAISREAVSFFNDGILNFNTTEQPRSPLSLPLSTENSRTESS